MTLNLETLRNGVMGLTPEFGSFCLQACTVCLNTSNHLNGVNAELTGIKSAKLRLNWTSAVTTQIKRNWADPEEATEYGATAIAILLANNLSNFTCIERSSKGPGFDYWLGDEDDFGIFQKKGRLEISGILKENSSNTLQARVKVKEKQTKKSSHSQKKAHICVTEFSNPKCEYKVIK